MAGKQTAAWSRSYFDSVKFGKSLLHVGLIPSLRLTNVQTVEDTVTIENTVTVENTVTIENTVAIENTVTIENCSKTTLRFYLYLHGLYVYVMESRWIKWTEHVASMEHKRRVCRGFVGKSEGRKRL